MTLTRRPRAGPLLGVVDLLWASGPAAHPTREEWSMPTGRVHLAFRPVGDPVEIDRHTTFHGWLVGGPRVGPHLRNSPRGARSVGVMLAPGASAALLGVPAHALAGRHVALGDLWGPAADSLADALYDLGPTETLDRLEAALVARVRDRRPSRRAVALVAGIEQGLPLGVLADRLGLGERQTRTSCWETLGMSPRDARRVARLQAVFEDWRRAPRRPWAERALLTGFADQAHLSREFKDLTGFTPAAWRPLPGEPRHVPVPADVSVPKASSSPSPRG